jgi:hypothetical protein
MGEGVDYSFSRPSPAGLAAAGKTFAMRYVGPGSDSKHLSTAERDSLWAAGLTVVLLAEGGASDALGGQSMGALHASSAEMARRALGAPALPIYFAIDFDVTVDQWPSVLSYLQGAASVIGAARVGIYGGLRAVTWAARDRGAAWFFQTYAWSAGQWFTGNHVEQYHNDVLVAGGTVDLCRSKLANFGQWSILGGGVNVAFMDDRDAAAMAWRVEAIFNNRPTAVAGPAIGERNLLHDKLEEILAAVKAGVTTEELSALSNAARAGAAAAINGATLHSP